ncbi:GTPase IMAP family member 7-like isoform X2 [Onychostoma macrolepis]|uniref:GTPase IMAP family member 7-like isoform X2 n=1 Tax=Onychostoma macrolepis TaxID=369639 RepID=UPI00272A2CF2|nr:GTPase IMAP family member 7-like isoform X2 [Onychostoma macrolepis]
MIPFHIGSTSLPDRRIVLLGKTGDGKSSAGNTILREQIFPVKSSPNSESAKSDVKDGMVDRRKVTVIDTPGIFDTTLDEEKVKSEIVKYVTDCAPRVAAVVIVLKVGRYTDQEMEIVDKILEYCGEDTFKHAVVLFTHGEQLEGQTIEEFVKKSEKLQKLVDKCGGRCHVIDNKYWKNRRWGYKSNRSQVRNLLKTIDKMVKENGCYTNEMLQISDEEIKYEIKNITEDNLSPEEKRDKAKKIVQKKLLIKLAGVTSGALIGAFLGVGVALASVVALLKGVKYIQPIKAIALAATAAEAAAGGAAAVEAGAAAGASIGAAAGTGIAAGVIFGAAALAGAIGGGITGYKAAEEANSVLDAIKITAKVNYGNAKEVIRQAEQLPNNICKKIQNN